MPSIESYWATHIGRKRTNNEDAIGALEPRNNQERRKNGALYVVADGLGGFQFGERASQYAVKTLLTEYPRFPQMPPGERLRVIIQKINSDLYEMAQRDLQEGEHMATTIVAAVIHRNLLYLAHVGDSRAYLIRDGNVYQLTADHSVIAELIRAGKLSEEEARGSKLRNRLTRSIGTRPQVEVELSQPIALKPGDLILLCTDGLSQYATSNDLLAAAYGQPREIVERLIAFANQQGGSDNISVAAIRFGTPALLPVSMPRWAQVGVLASLGVCLLLTGMISGLMMSSLPAWIATATSTSTHTLTSTSTSTPSATPTLTATFTETPTATSTETLTPGSTDTPTPSATPIPQKIMLTSTAPVTLTATERIVCIYTVVPNDTVVSIAKRFKIPEEKITRQDGSRSNMKLIKTGEKLLLHEVDRQVCLANGGRIYSDSNQ